MSADRDLSEMNTYSPVGGGMFWHPDVTDVRSEIGVSNDEVSEPVFGTILAYMKGRIL